MKRKTLVLFLLSLILCLPLSAAKAGGTFESGKGTFLLNGKPFVVKAAEIHYARIPQEYWEHRIQMCKALGMNTMCIYIFWNFHEQKEGVFDFTGNKDIAKFCRLAQKNGMYVIVRPGPYVCAEWEMGGLPWWLLKKTDIKLRTQDPYFMERVKIFEQKVGEQLAPLTIQNGGPIIMVQVENEYGSYDTNKPYVSEIRDCLRSVGFDKVQLFQCDWSSNFQQNALPDLLWTMNFGAGANVLEQFKKVKELRPDAPMMCSEYWSGWFDGWGRAHETRSAETMVNGIKTMLENNISFSLYMTHGGTSFGQWAGANVPGYDPDCTSYDYDAPIDEQGATTEKYYQLRELLQKYSDVKFPAVPKAKPIIEIPEVKFSEMAPLLRAGNMPEAQKSHDIKSMELFDQGYGSIMYSTTLPAIKAGALIQIRNMNDYGIVMIDGKQIGQLYRGNKAENTLRIPTDVKAGAQLDIFIEAMGRINYSKQIKDFKGITEGVEVYTTDGKNELTYNLKDWEVRLFPVSQDYNALNYIPTVADMKMPAYYRSSFNLSKVGDTYLDMSTWGKGMVWINGHNLGRFWKVGPQQTLYVPGCWLKKGKNEIVILDITGPSKTSVKGLKKPVITELHRDLMPKDAVKGDNLKKALSSRTNEAPSTTNGGLGNDAAPGAK